MKSGDFGRRVAALGCVAVILCACKQGPYKVFKTPNFIVEVPREWQNNDPSMDMEFSFSGPEHLETVSPDLALYPLGIDPTREAVEDLMRFQRKNREKHPGFRQGPLEIARIAGAEGYSYTWVYEERFHMFVARHTRDPLQGRDLKPVLLKQTEVYFKVPAGRFTLIYSSPEALYDKHRPAFDHAVATLKPRRKPG